MGSSDQMVYPGEVAAGEGGKVGEAAWRVPVPPNRPFSQVLRDNLKETFFPDDPLRQFRGHPPGLKVALALRYLFPILEWAPRYTFSDFRADLVSGITIASLAIPQGISYAKLARLPPIVGLCTSTSYTHTYSSCRSYIELHVNS